jgi:protein arginine N-methyltransferase 1
MFKTEGYSVSGFGWMAADLPRIQPYAEALRKVITPESVVLEIGTGTGVMAMHACQLGARHVYAIEVEDAIEVARESAAANGFADRITFIQAVASEVALPEPVDIMFSDLRGVLPLHNYHLETIMDARSRFLKPGGVQIPQQDTLYVSPVQAPDVYQQHVEPWTKNPFGLDMSAGRRWMVNRYYKARVAPEQMVLPAKVWAVLDYRTLTELNYAQTLTWTTEEAYTLHGLQVWFEAVLYGDVGFSTSPEYPSMAYNSTFFPFAEPVALVRGDELQVRLRADNFGGQYTFSWNTQVTDGQTGVVKVRLQQSTFFASVSSIREVRMRAGSFQPHLTNEGHVHAAILGWMADGLRVGEIAQRLTEQFAADYPSLDAAMAKAGDMSRRFGEFKTV